MPRPARAAPGQGVTNTPPGELVSGGRLAVVAVLGDVLAVGALEYLQREFGTRGVVVDVLDLGSVVCSDDACSDESSSRCGPYLAGQYCSGTSSMILAMSKYRRSDSMVAISARRNGTGSANRQSGLILRCSSIVGSACARSTMAFRSAHENHGLPRSRSRSPWVMQS